MLSLPMVYAQWPVFLVHLWSNQMCFSSHECWPHGAEFMLLDAFSGWD